MAIRFLQKNQHSVLYMYIHFLFRVKDRYKLTQALVVDPLYLQHSYSESAIDYRVIFGNFSNISIL